jgi:hypothetical protein
VAVPAQHVTAVPSETTGVEQLGATAGVAPPTTGCCHVTPAHEDIPLPLICQPPHASGHPQPQPNASSTDASGAVLASW